MSEEEEEEAHENIHKVVGWRAENEYYCYRAQVRWADNFGGCFEEEIFLGCMTDRAFLSV